MEIEVKCRLKDAESLRVRLAGHARYVQTVRQTDTLYDYPDERLQKKDEVLRVREERVLHGRDRGTQRVIATFKGAKKKSKLVKKREEHELELLAASADADDVARELGLTPRLRYEKIREEYEANGARIEIDSFPYEHVESYVEIEAPNEKRVHALMKTLRVSHKSVEKKSYPELVRAARKRKRQ
ncbi:class IV adenylate cyclase [Candidatus Micrarchaeota archaeon]|nr:class IV adenylate cyclase [Candidatus Micrarchaeota archaeon]